ncbi:unnamed protein product, partial [Discosporangium mesarthrocarpum]
VSVSVGVRVRVRVRVGTSQHRLCAKKKCGRPHTVPPLIIPCTSKCWRTMHLASILYFLFTKSMKSSHKNNELKQLPKHLLKQLLKQLRQQLLKQLHNSFNLLVSLNAGRIPRSPFCVFCTLTLRP